MALHPIQGPNTIPPGTWRVPEEVSRRAYEVYAHIWGEQQALVTGNCRGGFGLTELVTFLYARGFPRDEWRLRVEQASRGICMGTDPRNSR